MRRRDASELAAARRAHERPDGHVGVSGSPLVTIEALSVEGTRHDLAQSLEILLVLLPFRRRHLFCRRRRRRRSCSFRRYGDWWGVFSPFKRLRGFNKKLV